MFTCTTQKMIEYFRYVSMYQTCTDKDILYHSKRKFFKRQILASVFVFIVCFLLTTLIYASKLGEISTDIRETGFAFNGRTREIANLEFQTYGLTKKIIHFIESSGEQCLRPRQACSIEAAAISNPDFDIYLHMAVEPPPGTREPYLGEGLERHCKTMENIKAFPNVKIVRESLLSHLDDTPLEVLLLRLNQSVYADQHVTDAVRIALLYKKGGIYSDIDTIIFRSLRGLRNAAGHLVFRGNSLIENNFLIFDQGSSFLKYVMEVLAKEYKFDPENRVALGYVPLTKAFRDYCFHLRPEISPSISKYACRDGTELTLFNHTAFFAIGYDERIVYYKENFTQSDLDLLTNSYAAHIYDSGHGIHVPKTSLLAHLAKKYCPSVYGDYEKGVYEF